jgi:hypothetical protein
LKKPTLIVVKDGDQMLWMTSYYEAKTWNAEDKAEHKLFSLNFGGQRSIKHDNFYSCSCLIILFKILISALVLHPYLG